MTTVITLDEYERRSVELRDEDATALAGSAPRKLNVLRTADPGRYELVATQHVGTIALPGLHVLIRPKVPIENVLLLLEAGTPSWRAEQFDYATTGDLLPAFAGFFATALDRALATGLHRWYRVEEDWLPTIRGRLDLTAQFRRPGILSPVPCRFDEFTPDVDENRVLKAALRRLLRTPGIQTAVRRRLMHELARFELVADVYVDPSVVDRLHLHRLNQHYEPPLRLAQLILRNMTLQDRPGGRRASAFLVDMNDLFQRFVTGRVQRLLHGRLHVVPEPGGHLGHGRKVRLEPDLVFYRGRESAYVGDTKYKLLGDQLGRNADYYQLLAYTTALDLPEGVLIYCQADGDAPHKVVEVRHASKRLWTYLLDLSGSPTDVENALTELADWIAVHALPFASLARTA